MGKRVERYQKIKEEKKRKRQRFLAISFSLIFLLTGMITVDNSLREMMCVEDKGLFDYIIVEGKYNVKLIGKSFCIDFENVKTFFEDKTIIFIDGVSEIFNTIVGKISR